MSKNNSLLLLLFTFLILSCSESDNEIKEESNQEEKVYLKSIDLGSSAFYNFYYNNENSVDYVELEGTQNDFTKKFYYENGKIKRAEYFDENGNPTGSKEVYVYENNQIIERQDYLSSGEVDEIYQYTYNENLLETINYKGFNQTELSPLEKIEYDSEGRIISRENLQSNIITNYSYDHQKSPFLNFEPNIVLIDDFTGFVNNPISIEKINGESTEIINQINLSYEYNILNFPIKRTGNDQNWEYTYY
ncbi:hypothetical protein JM79_2039 [Gramella sp. Hel_I_59]|uniref:hypothetical protein n=1 Tax=Gramella sp. Hel_I_59 TaxID=1249978 RepID=UPI001151EEA6|nr:hypothetical protein [Gramella sp. Hel_I_59]TQI71113.1 hypothetical protein JM79_2039 [Gramella sp. Hel_I_59]